MVESQKYFEAPVEVLDALIGMAYTSKLNLTGVKMDTIGQLLRIASKYNITSLKQELSCHIKSTLSLSNALEYFKYASEHGLCQKDIQLIRAYILKKNFLTLNEQSNGFSKLSQQDLESFIMDDNLGLKEEELFNLITGWVKNGYPGRAFLLNHVRHQYMDTDSGPMNFMKKSTNFMSNAMNFMKNPMNFMKPPRNPKEMILVIGGEGMFMEQRNTTKSIFNIYRRLSCLLSKGIAKINKKFNSQDRFFVLLLHSINIPCGSLDRRSNVQDSVEIFNAATNEWSFGPSLTVPRLGAAAVVYNDKIYVIGGYDGTRGLKTVEVYDPLVSPNWQLHAKELNVARSWFAATVTEEKNLVIGGFLNTGRKTEKCEVFDEQSWAETKPLITARTLHTAVNLDHYSLNFKEFF